ncbi:unnamed protein product [Orchesella dallaii]|uniref:RING-type domain-containing protein n=1 Tax=Orchesella dallaii TaxID=48710 RepID=A0ABP1PTZ0_9HEXA
MNASLKRTVEHLSLGSQCSFQCIICDERLDQPSSIEVPTAEHERKKAKQQIQPSNGNNLEQPGPSRANGSNVGVGARDPNSVPLCTIDKKIIVATACGHMFHLLCIELWFSKKSNRNCCPLCDHVDQKIVRLFPNASAGSPASSEPPSSIDNIAPTRVVGGSNRSLKDTITGNVSGTHVMKTTGSAGTLVGNVTPFPSTSGNIDNNANTPASFPHVPLISNHTPSIVCFPNGQLLITNAPSTTGVVVSSNTYGAYLPYTPMCHAALNKRINSLCITNYVNPTMDKDSKDRIERFISRYNDSTWGRFAILRLMNSAYIEYKVARMDGNKEALLSVLADGHSTNLNRTATRETWLDIVSRYTAYIIKDNEDILSGMSTRRNNT